MTTLTLFCTLLIASSGVYSQTFPNPTNFIQQFLSAFQNGFGTGFNGLIRPPQTQAISQFLPFLPQNNNGRPPAAIIGQSPSGFQPINTGGVVNRPPRPPPNRPTASAPNRPTATTQTRPPLSSTTTTTTTSTSLPVETPEFTLPSTVIPGLPILPGSDIIAGINESDADLPIEEPIEDDINDSEIVNAAEV